MTRGARIPFLPFCVSGIMDPYFPYPGIVPNVRKHVTHHVTGHFPTTRARESIYKGTLFVDPPPIVRSEVDRQIHGSMGSLDRQIEGGELLLLPSGRHWTPGGPGGSGTGYDRYLTPFGALFGLLSINA
jgi:hypothetical protein